MNSEALVKQDHDEMKATAQYFADSGFFSDARDVAKAFVKIKAGAEMGVSAMAAMTGIAIIQNKPVVGANLVASRVVSSGYKYRVNFVTDLASDGATIGCSIKYFDRNGDALGESVFTKEDAKAAGLLGKDNWRKYPRNMYFARAMSNGQKWYCPDALSGVTVYTPDELGGDVNAEGEPLMKEGDYTVEDKKKDESITDIMKDAIKEESKSDDKDPPCTTDQQKCIYTITGAPPMELSQHETKRMVSNIVNYEVKSLKELSMRQATFLIDGLKKGEYDALSVKIKASKKQTAEDKAQSEIGF